MSLQCPLRMLQEIFSFLSLCGGRWIMWLVYLLSKQNLAHSHTAPFIAKPSRGIFIANQLLILSGCLGVNATHLDLVSLGPFEKVKGAPRHIPAWKACSTQDCLLSGINTSVTSHWLRRPSQSSRSTPPFFSTTSSGLQMPFLQTFSVIFVQNFQPVNIPQDPSLAAGGSLSPRGMPL